MMEKIVVESEYHLERIAEDVGRCGEEVRIEIKRKVRDRDALMRAVFRLLGKEPPRYTKEQKERREMFWGLLRSILKEKGKSIRDVPDELLRKGYRAWRYGTKADVLEAVSEIEENLPE